MGSEGLTSSNELRYAKEQLKQDSVLIVNRFVQILGICLHNSHSKEAVEEPSVWP